MVRFYFHTDTIPLLIANSTVPWDTYLTFPENDFFERYLSSLWNYSSRYSHLSLISSQSEADGHICNVQMPSERNELERLSEGNAFGERK